MRAGRHHAEDFGDESQREQVTAELTKLLGAAQAQLAKLPDDPQTVLMDVAQRVEELRRRFREGGKLPGFVEDFTALAAESLPAPPAIVDGLIRQGEKAVFGGASKSFKSWGTAGLTVAVATGSPWLGRGTTQGKVLFVNLELPRWCIQQRLMAIAHAMEATIQPGMLTVWTLRDVAMTGERLRASIPRLKLDGLKLAAVDPVYKLLNGHDENAAADVAALLAPLGGITLDTGAALVLPAHFAKGNAAGKEAQDRISGSGVFARDPDSVLTLTRHEEDNCFTVEASLRTFPPVEPFVAKWEHPLFRPAPDLDPDALRKVGRKRQYDFKKLLRAILDTDERHTVSLTEWAERAEVPRTTLTDYTPIMREKGWIKTSGEGRSARQFITAAGRRHAE